MKNIKFITVLLSLLFIGFGTISVFAQRANPSQSATNESRRKGPCRDPWISLAYANAAVGFGDYGQCNPKWYNNGSWNSYDELYNSVTEASNSWYQAGVRWQTKFYSNKTGAFYATVDGKKYGAIAKGVQAGTNGKAFDLVGQDGGTLVGNDGAGLIGNDAAGMVAAGGMNMVPMDAKVLSVTSGTVKKRIKIGKNTYLVIKQ